MDVDGEAVEELVGPLVEVPHLKFSEVDFISEKERFIRQFHVHLGSHFKLGFIFKNLII